MCSKAYPSCAFIPILAEIPIKILSTLHSNVNIVKNLEGSLFCPFFVHSPRIAGLVLDNLSFFSYYRRVLYLNPIMEYYV